GREERLRHIALARVGHDHDDSLPLGLRARGYPERCGQRCPTRDARKQPNPSRAAPGCLDRFFVGYREDLIEQLTVEHRRHESGPDALDAVGTRWSAGEYGRAPRLDRDHQELRVALAQELADPRDRAPGPDPRHQDIDSPFHGMLDLGS